MRPVVLTIAGSDSGGGAGIQADIRAIESQGGFATTAITAVTAQNTVGVRSIHPIPTSILRDQIDAVLEDFPVAAIKTGMLPDLAAIREVRRCAAQIADCPLVVDPVLVATSGARLSPGELGRVWLEELSPFATLWTPNIDEVAQLSGHSVDSGIGAQRAGQILIDRGAAAVLVTGGHLRGRVAVDWLVTPKGVTEFSSPWVSGAGTHGSGCCLASAIATHLALGETLEEAIRRSKIWVVRAIEEALPIGAGEGPVDPLWSWHDLRRDLR